MIRNDRGGEYESPFAEICLENGIIHQTTVPYTPQSNGIAERKNQTLKEMMNALLISSGLPHNLWGKLSLQQIKYLTQCLTQRQMYFHMRNGKVENPIWNTAKCGGV